LTVTKKSKRRKKILNMIRFICIVVVLMFLIAPVRLQSTIYFDQDLIPNTTGYDVGKSDYVWKNMYASGVSVSQHHIESAEVNTFEGVIFPESSVFDPNIALNYTVLTADVVPDSDSSHNLGIPPTYPFHDIYVDDVYIDTPIVESTSDIGSDNLPMKDVYCENTTYDAFTQSMYYDFFGDSQYSIAIEDQTTTSLRFVAERDDSGSWNNTYEKYNVPVDGLYSIYLFMDWSSFGLPSGNRIIEIQVSGTRVAGQTLFVQRDLTYPMSLMTTQVLNTGDDIKVYGYQNSGSTCYVISQMVIHLIHEVD
jgi:hypothetical protein